jgi:hypothetical protein
MRRMARAVPLARVRVEDLVNKIRHAPLEDWPKHLRMAREIFDPRLSPVLALDVLTRSVAAAYKCAQSINRRSVHLSQRDMQAKTAAALGRVVKCIGRAPAGLRQQLDDAVAAVRWHERIDTEVVADTIDATIAAFSAHPDCEPAQTALAALTTVEDSGARRRRLRNDYADLPWQVRANVEGALSALRSQGTATAAMVFATMASAARAGGSDRAGREVHPLIVDYVAEVAAIWRSAGLRPGRAVDEKRRTTYRGKFHRFVELVLTAIVEPWSRRHDENLDAVKQQIWSALARLPEHGRRGIVTTSRRSDIEWLVSDDHLKKALRKPVQKTGAETP